jgi:predicted nucleic acid-binding protein
VSGFLVDTNVVSEFIKPQPNPQVIRRLRDADPESLFVSVIVFAEIRLGIEDLEFGKRRFTLEQWIQTGLPTWWESNCLPITRIIAARWRGSPLKLTKRKGATIATADGSIAATALEHELTLVTRDIHDFAVVAVPVLNPWES